MADRTNGSEDISSVKVASAANDKSWIWWLLGLLLLGLILLLLWANHKRDTPQTTNANNANSQSSSSLKSAFDRDVASTDRIVYFNPDTADLQDTMAATASIAKVVAFYQSNHGTKLVVNGSIFNGQPGDSGNPLAQQRGQLIKQKLVDGGIGANDVTITSINTYQGNTDAAKADYARSVTIEAQ